MSKTRRTTSRTTISGKLVEAMVLLDRASGVLLDIAEHLARIAEATRKAKP